MCARLNQVFGLLLVDSCDSDRECGGKNKAPRVVPTETNFSNDFDVFVRKSQPGITAYAEECALEASGLAAGEKRLRVSCISLATKFTRQGQLHLEQAVLAGIWP